MRPDSPKTPRQSQDPLLRGHRGGVISMHRALTHFRLGPMNVLASVSLLVCFSAAWIALLPSLCRFWRSFFLLSLKWLPIHGTLELAKHRFGSSYELDIPYLRIYSMLPDLWNLGGRLRRHCAIVRRDISVGQEPCAADLCDPRNFVGARQRAVLFCSLAGRISPRA